MPITTMSANDAMLIIKTLDPEASLRFSEYTGQWYLSANVEVTNGVIASSVCEHRDDPHAAVLGFMYRIQDVDLESAVSYRHDGERRYCRWNGAAFAPQPRPGAV